MSLDAVELLGKFVQDKITNLRGTVVSVHVTISGEQKVEIQPGVGSDGAFRDGTWAFAEKVEVIEYLN